MKPSDRQTDIMLRPLAPDLYPGFERLLAQAWEQNWSGKLAEDILRWRYYERPGNHVTWLACVGSECVAMVDSQTHRYLLNGQPIVVRETADWFCLPEYRRFGLGLRVLRQLKDYPEPVLVVGGSVSTRQILPRLGWDILNPVRSYVLPITARGFAANLLRQKWWEREALAGIIPRRLRFRSPVHKAAPSPNAEVEILTGDNWYETRPGSTSRLVPMLEKGHWDWLASMPEDFARPLCAVFRLDGSAVGLTLSQLEPTATGFDGRIVHIQVANRDPALIAWILSATTDMLVERGAEFIRCFVSTPEKMAAIESLGFILTQELPSHWWGRPGLPVPTSIDVDYLRGDDAQPLAAIRGRRLDRTQRRKQEKTAVGNERSSARPTPSDSPAWSRNATKA